jgi:hypothetical protein
MRRRTMSSIGTTARIATTLTVIGVLGALSCPGQAAAPPFDVIVDNPITLNPATPNPVTITNPPGAPPSTVTIANPVSAADIAKALGVQHPTALDFAIEANANSPTFNVPANQRLIIEFAAGRCNVANGIISEVQIVTTASTNTHFYPLNVAPLTTVTAFFVAINFAHLVKIYADPGTRIEVDAGFGGTLGGPPVAGNCQVTLSGQLIDVP